MTHDGYRHQHQTEGCDAEEKQDCPTDINRELRDSSIQHLRPHDFMRAMRESNRLTGRGEKI